MNAMQLMLKQLGLDPEELKTSAENIGILVGQISERLAALEARGQRIENKLDLLLEGKAAPLQIAAPTQQVSD